MTAPGKTGADMYFVAPFDIYISPREAAAILDISRQRAYQLIRDGKLQARDVRGRMGVSVRSLERRYASFQPGNAEPPKNLRELDRWLKAALSRAKRLAGSGSRPHSSARGATSVISRAPRRKVK